MLNNTSVPWRERKVVMQNDSRSLHFVCSGVRLNQVQQSQRPRIFMACFTRSVAGDFSRSNDCVYIVRQLKLGITDGDSELAVLITMFSG